MRAAHTTLRWRFSILLNGHDILWIALSVKSTGGRKFSAAKTAPMSTMYAV